mmetsp:Transcript_25585/g.35321  ORF Transcript_25585/g.35321 Transcript_25585/m.35321 type:complete len:130 (+) Transcript_25585:99-488(+)|eukprot:CAMPEP_0196571298 /NCGR_PEP_ID=MMETSP1081-20130531/1470_1 /TAXON_ID=36882 /ORGANISM="Pyramimonas amylifera, Strain CCMP720" /LENGTH=129 /DNA_ID=CAMNT_0041888179 /DNA_START=93 /DNA_END=482 /DNA_ORIENTATION=-
MMSVASSSVVGIPSLSAARRVSKNGSVQKLAASPVRISAARKAVVVCKAENKALAGVSAAIATFAASPAFAVVDQRMNGDGTGLALGINDSSLLWVLVIVPALVFSAYYYGGAVGDLGGDDGDDSGLSL